MKLATTVNQGKPFDPELLAANYSRPMKDVAPVEGLKVVARRAAERLADVDGVAAVAMGGSLARGAADASSDVDLGLYYHGDRPLDVDALRALARELDDRHPTDAVTDIGGWGPWINASTPTCSWARSFTAPRWSTATAPWRR